MKKCESCGSTKNVNFNSRYDGLLCARHKEQMRRFGFIRVRTKSDKNTFLLKKNYYEMVIYDNRGEEKCIALIDLADKAKIEKYSWCQDGGGYIQNFKLGTLHKFLLGKKNGLEIDHINRNKLDNRRTNLRFVSKSINNSNRGKGNVYRTINGRWSASIGFKGKQKYLGTFNTEKEAKKIAQKAKDILADGGTIDSFLATI